MPYKRAKNMNSVKIVMISRNRKVFNDDFRIYACIVCIFASKHFKTTMI